MRPLKIPFSKIQGCGNSFVICEKRKGIPSNFNWGKLSQKICNPDFGVGADTLLVLSRGRRAPYLMEVYNPDGSKAQVSGNGTRCVVRYLLDRGVKPHSTALIETVKGLVETEITDSKRSSFEVRVNLGRQVREIKGMNLRIGNKIIPVVYVDIGNPHAVRLVRQFPDDWEKSGFSIEHHRLYPKRVNVEFCRVIDGKNLEVKVWERGVGRVLSSGTGASAAVLAGIYLGRLSGKVKAHMAGGSLEIEFNPDKKNLFITGPAQTVCRGVFYPDA
ncbi:MAG: diaminopimelate epimerase [candidate division Zixibacteria bacterium]|nr:diaminopimelate epimerase [candidate division Zixibacteria bacterium]